MQVRQGRNTRETETSETKISPCGEAMQTSRPTSASGEDDDEDADRSEEYSDDGRVSD